MCDGKCKYGDGGKTARSNQRLWGHARVSSEIFETVSLSEAKDPIRVFVEILHFVQNDGNVSYPSVGTSQLTLMIVI